MKRDKLVEIQRELAAALALFTESGSGRRKKRFLPPTRERALFANLRRIALLTEDARLELSGADLACTCDRTANCSFHNPRGA